MQLHLLTSLFECVTPKEWGDMLFSIANECGFDRVLFGVIPSKLASFETAFIMSNYSREWRSIYDEFNLHTIDPTVTHCLTHVRPIIWKPESFKGKDQATFYEQACFFGLRSGITFPIHGDSGEFGILSFVNGFADKNKESFETMALLSLIRDYAFESSKKFFQLATSLKSQVKLTRCELECLKWAMNGKSSWEISRIVSCSEATVNFHIANLKKKFDVSTRQQAIVKAIQLGLVIPS